MTYSSTNYSIIITKREIRNFLSQLSLAPVILLQQTPKKHRNFHRNFFEKLLRNQDFYAATITTTGREILGGLPWKVVGPCHEFGEISSSQPGYQRCPLHLSWATGRVRAGSSPLVALGEIEFC